MKNRSALQFVLIIGIVNFFADFTYEGAREIVGPFLGSLGASAAVLGFVAGLGELMGYALRSVSGYFADKLHRHWVFAFLGYAVNMFAVPALACSHAMATRGNSRRCRACWSRHSQADRGRNAVVRR
jgi:hypothetical protein